MDEQQWYYQETLNDWDYSKDNGPDSDDAQFANITNFEETENVSPLLSENPFYSVGDNTLEQLEKETNGF